LLKTAFLPGTVNFGGTFNLGTLRPAGAGGTGAETASGSLTGSGGTAGVLFAPEEKPKESSSSSGELSAETGADTVFGGALKPFFGNSVKTSLSVLSSIRIPCFL
jgi:hypothetical protein